MIAGSSERVASGPRSSRLALSCLVVWAVAAASAGALGIWLSIGGAAVALGGAVLLLDRAAARAALRPARRLLLLGAAAGGALAAASYLLYPLLARGWPFLASETALLYSEFHSAPLLFASIALGPVVLGEELVWRGVVQGALAERFGAGAGAVLAALAYALALTPLGSPVLVAVALLFGLAWGTLRAASGSLVPSLLAHLIWDVLVLVWLPLESSGSPS